MKRKPLDAQISVNPTQDDLTDINEIALTERRKPTEVIRNILEDVVAGRIPLEVVGDAKSPRKTTGVKVDAEFKTRLEEFKAATHLSTDKILHLALKNLAGRALYHKAGAGKTLPDNLPADRPVVFLSDRAGLLSDHPSIPLACQPPANQTLAQKALAGQASIDEITEHLIAKQIEESRHKVPYTAEEREAAIKSLMEKHHDGSSHRKSSPQIMDASQLDLEDVA
jgi:hypothetical protein